MNQTYRVLIAVLARGGNTPTITVIDHVSEEAAEATYKAITVDRQSSYNFKYEATKLF